jgi:putative oxidoreductase
MNAEPTTLVATPLAGAVARFTSAAFRYAPAWLALSLLRLTLARPFFASGLTRWDRWFTLSFGTKVLFSDEYRLHILGAEIPFPLPELVAATASTAEIALPVCVALGFLTRYAALGLLCMTAVIQLVYPDGWRDFHLPWAGMALAIMAFGPGAFSLDRLLGIDAVFPQHAPR